MTQILNPRHFNHLSRYKRNRQVYNSDVDKIYLETMNRYDIIVSDTPIYHVVDVTEENRLDKIAFNYYGDASLYWAIAMVNNIIDPFIVQMNTILIIPYIEDLFDNDGPLSIARM